MQRKFVPQVVSESSLFLPLLWCKIVGSVLVTAVPYFQHLATFTLERKGAMLTVDDSIRKLKLLDAKGKIWTQEVFLYVDDKCIKLLDVQDRVSACAGKAH